MKPEHVIAATLGIGAFLLFINGAKGASYRLSLDCGPFFKLSETASTPRCDDFCFLFKSAQAYFDALTKSFPICNVQSYIQNFVNATNSFDLGNCAAQIYRLQCK